MVNVIIILILAVFIAGGIRSVVRRAGGKSCCSGGDSEIAVEPSDKNKKNYSRTVEISIDGMKCTNCAKHIQNKLNECSGVWAKVSFSRKNAVVLVKDGVENQQLSDVITKAGYSVTSIK